jgi:hypothetical protein
MRAPDSDHLMRSFEDRLRGWIQRPPRIPADIAKSRVLARLPDVSRPVPWMRLIAAAALVSVLVVAVWLGSPRPAGEGSGNTTVAFAPSLDSNVVMWVVDSRTTVYFVLSRDGSEKRGVS